MDARPNRPPETELTTPTPSTLVSRSAEVSRIISLLEQKDRFLDQSEEKDGLEKCALRAKNIQVRGDLIQELQALGLETKAEEETRGVAKIRARLWDVFYRETPETHVFCERAFQAHVMLTQQWPENDFENGEPIDLITTDPIAIGERVAIGNRVYAKRTLERYLATNNAYRLSQDLQEIEVLDPDGRQALTHRELAYLEHCGLKMPVRDGRLLNAIQVAHDIGQGGMLVTAGLRSRGRRRSSIDFSLRSHAVLDQMEQLNQIELFSQNEPQLMLDLLRREQVLLVMRVIMGQLLFVISSSVGVAAAFIASSLMTEAPTRLRVQEKELCQEEDTSPQKQQYSQGARLLLDLAQSLESTTTALISPRTSAGILGALEEKDEHSSLQSMLWLQQHIHEASRARETEEGKKEGGLKPLKQG